MITINNGLYSFFRNDLKKKKNTKLKNKLVRDDSYLLIFNNIIVYHS